MQPYIVTSYSALKGAYKACAIFVHQVVVVPMLLDSPYSHCTDLGYVIIPLKKRPCFRSRHRPFGRCGNCVIPLKMADVAPGTTTSEGLTVVGFDEEGDESNQDDEQDSERLVIPSPRRWPVHLQSVGATNLVFHNKAPVGAAILNRHGNVVAINLPYNDHDCTGQALRTDILLHHYSQRNPNWCTLPCANDFCGQQHVVTKLRGLLNKGDTDGNANHKGNNDTCIGNGMGKGNGSPSGSVNTSSKSTAMQRIVIPKGPPQCGKSSVLAEALKHFPKQKLLFVPVQDYPDHAALPNIVEEILKMRHHSLRDVSVADAATKLRQYVVAQGRSRQLEMS